MRLINVLELGAREGARRFCEKRAGVMLPLAVGAMLPSIAARAAERAHATEAQLDPRPHKVAAVPPWMAALGRGAASVGRGLGHAAGQLDDGAEHTIRSGLGSIAGAPASGVASGLSKFIERKLFGQEFGQRQDALGIGGRKAIEAAGSELGKSSVGLLRDIANKAMSAIGHAGDAGARTAILGDLKRTDPILSNADDGTLMEAYHTMTRFAPTLSTDKNAVRSFLRQAVMSGAGPDFMSIKLIADAERAVTTPKDKP